MDKERQSEINTVINLIQGFCETANIVLVAKEVRGINLVAIHDNADGQDYVMKKVGK